MSIHWHSRGLLGGLATTIVALAFTPVPAVSAEPRVSEKTAKPLVSAVDGVELVVSDRARSRSFFESIGFIFEGEDEFMGAAAAARSGLSGTHLRRVRLSLGTEHLALLQYSSPADGRPVPSDSRGNDLWFQHVAIVVSDMDRAFSWLRAQHVAYVSSAPQTLPAWNAAAGGIQAFYFADPDGHTLEIIHFPKGKGDPRWQAQTGCARTPAPLCLFLGIDHTAITVSDTDQSLAFYRDRLGMQIVGESENYGPEQEHLNGVFGARLRITALRAASGPGLELLQYLSPRGGRPMPHDARANDLFHWQIVVGATDSERVGKAASATGGHAISRLAEAHELIVRDRDGHALLVHESPEDRVFSRLGASSVTGPSPRRN
jgi:catechol 2,3-dioxygenase-like lactoylglutathione lyase family enzyme